MSEAITPTELRKNLYRLLDQVLETGQPLRIDRGGQLILIIPATAHRRFGDGPRLDCTPCTIDELASISWEHAWTPADLAP